jgi:hypothetical protein
MICCFPTKNYQMNLMNKCFSTEQNSFLNFCKSLSCYGWPENTLRVILLSSGSQTLKSCF